jgi:hypothetical protein
MNDLRMDLKVCEGCGALWLRATVVNGVYCRGCAGRLAEYPAPRKIHAGGRKRLARVKGCSARVASIGVASIGGAR